MAIDKMKVAALARVQGPMPPLPGKLKARVGAPAGAAKIDPNDGQLKPQQAKPPKPNPEDMTPQEMAEMVEQAAQAAEAGSDIELEDQLVDFLGGDTTQPPAWADPAMWAKAAEAVGIGTPNEDRYNEPQVVVAYLYKAMGGGMSGEEQEAPSGENEMPSGENEMPAAQPNLAQKAAKAIKKPAPEGAEAPPPAAVKPAGAKAAPAAPKPPPAAEGAEGAGAGDELKALVDTAAQEAESNPDPAIAEKVAAYNPEVDGSPPSWAPDADKWTKAEAAVAPHMAEYANPVMVIAHLYKAMGGTIA